MPNQYFPYLSPFLSFSLSLSLSLSASLVFFLGEGNTRLREKGVTNFSPVFRLQGVFLSSLISTSSFLRASINIWKILNVVIGIRMELFLTST